MKLSLLLFETSFWLMAVPCQQFFGPPALGTYWNFRSLQQRQSCACVNSFLSSSPIRGLTAVLLLCFLLSVSAETQSDGFLRLKIQMSEAVSPADTFNFHKWAPVVKYSRRPQPEVKSCCVLPHLPPFLNQYLALLYLLNELWFLGVGPWLKDAWSIKA